MSLKEQIKKIAKKPAARREAARKEGDTKMMSFSRAIASCFKKYVQFSGTATRAEYWWFVALLFGVSCVLVLSAVRIQYVSLLVAGWIAMLWVLFMLVVFVPWWAVMARRLHDAGFSAKWLLISFAFFVYAMIIPDIPVFVDWLRMIWGIVMVVLFVLPTKIANNPYRK